ncbi:hypothetical protein BDV95DRAFT_608843 [Massariosphaeria phaeospora]|uniref:DUF7896 domain-containing protein n=1 Tax=Massariosphaeria phaeospora TaxID=100035 RepID=A0A7C8M5J9_9PLEO|nr:hypothetical protein BDV95DRAFT_608843 [Massariosphaeria phaeospora]
MAAALSSTANLQPDILEQAKQDLWNGLSDQQRQQLWLQAAANVPSNAFSTAAQPAMAADVPRSMPCTAAMFAHTPTLDLSSRSHSAPVPIAMSRSVSSTSGTGNCTLQRSASAMPSWQSAAEEQATNEYTLFSDSASMRKQSFLHPIAETEPYLDTGVVEYTPDEYMNHIQMSPSPPLTFAHNHNPHQLHVQLTPNAQWSPSSDDSISPSSTALTTPVTQSSNVMGRQGSYNPLFLENVSMLRMNSDSNVMPILPEDGSFSFPSDYDAKTISACADTSSHFLGFTGSSSETFLSPAHASACASALVSSEYQSCLAEDMWRSTSCSSDSNASSASGLSSSSRQTRREREIMAQAERKIAPKAVENDDQTNSALSTEKMVRITSGDGSSKDVGLLTKTPYIRPQHPKVMCHFCDERPDGFRGTHELERHVARAHASTRKGYICIDSSSDGKFLASCKHCRNKKVYGAYYNAAAHLRRAHFNPRTRGRKGKHDQKRGGIGGGDKPAMEILKEHWIREVEVENKQIVQISSSPADSGSESIGVSHSNLDSAYDYTEASPSYSAQPTADMNNNQLDSSQFVDYDGMYVNSSDMADSSAPFAAFNAPSSANGDLDSFQFDAYMNMTQ